MHRPTTFALLLVTLTSLACFLKDGESPGVDLCTEQGECEQSADNVGNCTGWAESDWDEAGYTGCKGEYRKLVKCQLEGATCSGNVYEPGSCPDEQLDFDICVEAGGY